MFGVLSDWRSALHIGGKVNTFYNVWKVVRGKETPFCLSDYRCIFSILLWVLFAKSTNHYEYVTFVIDMPSLLILFRLASASATAVIVSV